MLACHAALVLRRRSCAEWTGLGPWCVKGVRLSARPFKPSDDGWACGGCSVNSWERDRSEKHGALRHAAAATTSWSAKRLRIISCTSSGIAASASPPSTRRAGGADWRAWTLYVAARRRSVRGVRRRWPRLPGWCRAGSSSSSRRCTRPRRCLCRWRGVRLWVHHARDRLLDVGEPGRGVVRHGLDLVRVQGATHGQNRPAVSSIAALVLPLRAPARKRAPTVSACDGSRFALPTSDRPLFYAKQAPGSNCFQRFKSRADERPTAPICTGAQRSSSTTSIPLVAGGSGSSLASPCTYCTMCTNPGCSEME